MLCPNHYYFLSYSSRRKELEFEHERVSPKMNIPLFIVTGCSGSGKTTISQELGKRMHDFTVFDMDLIVNHDDYQTACNNWIRIAYQLAKYGRKTILFGNVPSPYNIQICDRIRYFSNIKYLHLHCSLEARMQRLLARGGPWNKQNIYHYHQFAERLLVQARESKPPTPVIDTSKFSVVDSMKMISSWAKSNE